MRRDLLEQVLSPRITLADAERATRVVWKHDPLQAEEMVGRLYGLYFRRLEAAYDARGGRKR